MKIENIKINQLYLILIFCLIISCDKKDDDGSGEDGNITVELDNEINEFIWGGLNEIYLWNDDVPNLTDDRFSTFDEYYTFLNTYNTPEELFDDLIYQKGVIDKFSFLVDDYVELENAFSGITKSNGMDFEIIRISSDSDNLLGYVRYIANGSNAASKDISRGEFFLGVNGEQLTLNNYSDLLFGFSDTYTLDMADIDNGTISLNGKTVELTKTEFTENPILINKVIESQGTKIGYVMYNQFILDFNDELNNAFSELKSQNITELVLDLRYNLGGSVDSAIILSSIITGQFAGELFNKQQWNNRYQNFFEANAPERLIDNFTTTLTDGTTPITTLNLNKVYILTTEDSASASELVINGLSPYIDVVQIGTNTSGKYVASITLYDSENFIRENANTNHTYATQPIVYKSENADGVSDYFDGLTPDHLITYETTTGNTIEGENIFNLGVLGDVNEPFLAKAIELITGATSKTSNTKSKTGINFEKIVSVKDFSPLGNNMYIKNPFE